MDHQTYLKTHSDLTTHFACQLSTLEKFECDFCEFKTDLNIHLKRHVDLVHRKVDSRFLDQLRFYECCRCKFRTYSILLFSSHVCCKHVKGHRTLSGKFAVQATRIGKSLHRKSNNLKWKWTNIKPTIWYECIKCPYKSIMKSILEEHVVTTHKKLEDVGCFKCPKCPYRTVVKINLQLHTIEHMGSNEVKWFKCGQCPSKFKLKANLRRHMLVIHTPRWFTCNECSFKTISRVSLEQHVFARHPKLEDIDCSKCYKCTDCSYRTKVKKCLKSHIIKHASSDEVKWFKCEHCSFNTKYPSNLKLHVISQHRQIAKSGQVDGPQVGITFSQVGIQLLKSSLSLIKNSEVV